MSKFLTATIQPALAPFGFTRHGMEFHAQTPERVMAYVDFRAKRIQSDTVSFLVDVGVLLPSTLDTHLEIVKRMGGRPVAKEKAKWGGLGFSDSRDRVRVPGGYVSVVVDPIMARRDDLFSFFEDGRAVDECAEAFALSWRTMTWPWFEKRSTLDSLARLRFAPLREIAALQEELARDAAKVCGTAEGAGRETPLFSQED